MARVKIIKALGLLYEVPLALLVVGVVGGLVLGEGLYLAAFAVGAAATLAVVVARANGRALGGWKQAAVATVVLVAAGLLPLRADNQDLLTAEGLEAGLDELRGVATTYDLIAIGDDYLRGQRGDRALIYRDGDLQPVPRDMTGPDPEYAFDLREVDFGAIPGLVGLARQRFPDATGEAEVRITRPPGGGPVEITVLVERSGPERRGELVADAAGNPR
ncbi:hypothetical protein [Amycolatopsis thermalba]|uniref:hypothetical protein n=1 Tax=Amycolatopsis thermalba TaxID=944492 RepID=UPI0013BE8C5C|nr:hypothetical protein [Amycolatopsis thermalba]